MIWNLKLALTLNKSYEKTGKLTTWYDFTIQKEHLFLINIYSCKELKWSENISTLEK